MKKWLWPAAVFAAIVAAAWAWGIDPLDPGLWLLLAGLLVIYLAAREER